MADFACKECHMILEESSCPRCPEAEISREWQGFVEILKVTKSMVFLNCKLKSKNRIIATALGIWKILNRPLPNAGLGG